MSGGFPITPNLCNGTSVGTTGSLPYGTAITTGGTNAMGSWTQITASTAADCCFMGVAIFNNNGSSGTGAINVGVGAAASEKIIAQQLIVAEATGDGQWENYYFPVCIPAGTRVSVQAQQTKSAQTINVVLYFYDGDFSQIEAAGVDLIGFVAASTQGTTITANATPGSKGAYSTLVASTARDYQGISYSFDSLNTTATNGGFLVDIAIGAAASEKIIVPDCAARFASGIEVIFPNNLGFFIPIDIPSGTRVSARSTCNAVSGTIGLTCYGLYK